MNKQQLAAKIWESANQMRSKIEANEYKDYILGFIFYKYLSDKEVQFAIKEDFSQDDIKAISEEDEEIVKHFKKNLGYFISYENLFSTWIDLKSEFDVSNVRDALSAFSRLISKNHKKVYEGIFDTLQTGLSKLGDTAGSQTKAIKNLLYLIDDIPMDGKQGYDVLGFIYEYLIGKFAANAGKKAGEFYTPHEVSYLMSEIAAHHCKDKKEIQIYDPTSGSGSLLINIGQSVAKHIDDKNNIKYYAQELKQNTYNLTRMNLVMRDILPNNIVTRNGDTLEEDWPYFDENDPVKTYNPLYVDVVVSNPPYSQRWETSNKDTDPRYARFGLAPKAKADYAFLLHDLYHLKPDGIMTIVLPHGVLFRGGEEGNIRKNLIEGNHIDAIIGLPAKIFFGTSIETIIIILKQKRENTDVLIVDASKGFVKSGNNNLLQASDIKRIADTVINRESIMKFSKVVKRDVIRKNDYNLNISRYVDSSEDAETWDIYSTMFGGIPNSELDSLSKYWNAFPQLRKDLFKPTSEAYSTLITENINQFITNHSDIEKFVKTFSSSFSDFDVFLKDSLISKAQTLNVAKEEDALSDELFRRLEPLALLDKYEGYQLLNDEWENIAIDLEMIQTEGFAATRKVNPYMVKKKVNNKVQDVQDGWEGHIMPFDLVQEVMLKDELDELQSKESRLQEIKDTYEIIIDSLSQEEKDSEVLNDANTAFATKGVTSVLKDIFVDVESDEINCLKDYLGLLEIKAKKQEKMKFIESNTNVAWSNMQANKDNTYGKGAVNKYLIELQSKHDFPVDSFEGKLVNASKLLSEEKDLKKQIKEVAYNLHLLTKKTIEELSDSEVNNLLEAKWINPIAKSIQEMPSNLINDLTEKIQSIQEKYKTTYSEVVEDIKTTENNLSSLMNDLTGNEFDIKGVQEFKSYLNQKQDEN